LEKKKSREHEISGYIQGFEGEVKLEHKIKRRKPLPIKQQGKKVDRGREGVKRRAGRNTTVGGESSKA